MKKAGGVHERVMTRAQIEQQIDRLVSKAGARSRDEAFRQVDGGELAGTIVEAELRMLRSLVRGARD